MKWLLNLKSSLGDSLRAMSTEPSCYIVLLIQLIFFILEAGLDVTKPGQPTSLEKRKLHIFNSKETEINKFAYIKLAQHCTNNSVNFHIVAMQRDEQTDASFSRHSYKKTSHITVNTDVPWYSMSPSVTMARVEMSQTRSNKQHCYYTV